MIAGFEPQLREIQTAARLLRASPKIQRNRFLLELASNLKRKSQQILEANALDLQLLSEGATPAFRDRLLLSDLRIDGMVKSVKYIRSLPDPVGEMVQRYKLKNGLRVRRERAPLGVIFLIFESRPNVAIESFALAAKAGNAMILRGGRESRYTVGVLYELIQDALKKVKLPEAALWGVTDPDRAIPQALLQQSRFIDVVVPRGGENLIKFTQENSKIPIIKNDRGLCHVYVHEDASLAMAKEIVVNAKTQRPGVCNSMETLLVHRKIAPKFLPLLHKAMKIEWKACSRTREILSHGAGVMIAREADWDTEHLDLVMNCRVVDSLDEAIQHIELHGSKHSEAIVTKSSKAARRFQKEVDAAAVYWNASTRFTDGYELGLGGELGISTQKLHVRGPVGLRELTSVRWVMDGKGQVRK